MTLSFATDGSVNGGQSDANNTNDEFVMSVAYQTAIASTLPYYQDFDGWNLISTDKACGTNATLYNNWENADNTETDDLDWRVGTGSTQTSNTGPSSGNGGSDNYLYTEGGKGGSKCKYMEGIAITTAFDLNDLERPTLQFSYHMYGSNIGTFMVGLLHKLWRFCCPLQKVGGARKYVENR